ncbi:MAG: HNH endonuclease [Alphaproteobacteria bacterium]|nr:MAG: HNH endonuclease [Alphaproteobacteria bacterium]
MRKSRKNSLVKCKIEGCDRDAMYIEKELCQKHYFRIMRNGHATTLNRREGKEGFRESKDKIFTPNGYVRIYNYKHPLSVKNYVFEHRFVMYRKYGETLPPCELCGKEINWDNCHIDHIDENRLNNTESNLRPLCRPCNTGRTERSTIKKYEYLGKLLTVTQLSKINGVQVCRAHLKRRIDSGMNITNAMFSKNITHPK